MRKLTVAAIIAVMAAGVFTGCGNAAGVQGGGTGNSPAGQTSGQTSGQASGQASDGPVVSSDLEKIRDDGRGGNASTAVSREQAMETALAKVPGAAEKDIRIELDYDDGRYRYEGDIIYDRVEYDFEIDADSGEIVEWSEERN